MMSLVGDNPTDVLPDPLSMTGRETEAISTCAGVRPTIGSSDTEVVTDTSGIVIIVAASTATETTANSTALGSPAEVWTVLSSALMIFAGPLFEHPSALCKPQR